MKHHRLKTLGVVFAALVSVALVSTATAAPVTVNLRIEGATSTTFEGQVTTDGKTIDGHPCDGTNGGANPTPGPTMTSALDDASIAHGFPWSGTWFDSIHDFGIDSIGPDANTSTQFWGYAYQGKPSDLGGCQQQVHNGDSVLYAFDFFSKVHLLQLSGPATAQVGQPVTVKVVDSQNNSAVAGASVGGATTGADGSATFTYPTAGTVRLKADKSDSVRSNELDVCVYTPGTSECNQVPPPAAGDSVAPDVTISSIKKGQKFAHGKGPRKLSGKASDAGGLFQVYFSLTRVTHAGCQWYSSKRSVFTNLHKRCNARFQRVGSNPTWNYLLPKRLGPGRYTLVEKAIDKSYNGSRATVTFTVKR
jgi:hypothetical protein